MATHSSILAWRSPWTEEPGKLWSTESQKSRTRLKRLSTHAHTPITKVKQAPADRDPFPESPPGGRRMTVQKGLPGLDPQRPRGLRDQLTEAAGSDPGRSVPSPGRTAPAQEPSSSTPAPTPGRTGDPHRLRIRCPCSPRWQCRECPLSSDRSTATVSSFKRKRVLSWERRETPGETGNQKAGDEHRSTS